MSNVPNINLNGGTYSAAVHPIQSGKLINGSKTKAYTTLMKLMGDYINAGFAIQYHETAERVPVSPYSGKKVRQLTATFTASPDEA